MNKDRLGYYRVGWKKFYNKTLALIENKNTGYELEWVFNDDVYGGKNWSIPIQDSLESLYAKRAKQLREKYDYLVLYFSGGADSLNILKTFLDNNIFLDEIVMQFPKPVESTFNEHDKSNKNFYSEIKYQAIPSLTKFQSKIHPNTKIRYQDFSKPLLDLLDKEHWFEEMPVGTNISPAGIARQITQLKEDHIIDLCYKKTNIAQILGVDKPLVVFNGKDYYAYFSDLNAMHSPPVDFSTKDIFENFYHTEFFYWTPDVPEIVIKQAQLIKMHCEKSVQARELIMKSMEKHIQHLRPLLHSIIYPQDLEVNWDPEKPSSKVYRPMDEWFWKIATDTQKGNYLSVINFLKNNTNSKWMINNNLENGFSAHTSKFYKL
jgi:hypothetical protein